MAHMLDEFEHGPSIAEAITSQKESSVKTQENEEKQQTEKPLSKDQRTHTPVMRNNLNRRKRAKHEITRLNISECEKDFETFDEGDNQNSITHTSTFTCEICGKTYISRKGIRLHKEKVHKTDTNVSKYTCSICDKTFLEFSHYKGHINTHYELKPYKCLKCKKMFSYKSNFCRHMKICSQKFSSECVLKEEPCGEHTKDEFANNNCYKMFVEFEHSPSIISASKDEEESLVKTQETTKQQQQEKLFLCDQCTYSSKTRYNLNRHKRIKHLSRFNCSECGKDFETADERDSHKSITHTSTFTCEICGKTYTSRKGIRLHKERVHNTDTYMSKYTCSICDKTFHEFSHYEGHINTHYGLKPYKCSRCEKTFSYKTNYCRHVKKCNGNDDYTCPICFPEFSSESVFEEQYCGKHSKDRFSSSSCHKFQIPDFVHGPSITTASKDEDESSVKIQENVEQQQRGKLLLCDQCAYTSKTRYNLNRHKRAKHETLSFYCTECGKDFETVEDRDNHKSIKHSFALMCETCGKTYTSKKGIKLHKEKVHKTDMNMSKYTCNICDKTFLESSHYIGHVNTHYGVAPYQCSKCGKTFSYKSNYCRHAKKCNGCREYVCKICSVEFSSKRVLKEHHRGKHTDNGFACSNCYKVFPWRASLMRHKKECVTCTI